MCDRGTPCRTDGLAPSGTEQTGLASASSAQRKKPRFCAGPGIDKRGTPRIRPQGAVSRSCKSATPKAKTVTYAARLLEPRSVCRPGSVGRRVQWQKRVRRWRAWPRAARSSARPSAPADLSEPRTVQNGYEAGLSKRDRSITCRASPWPKNAVANLRGQAWHGGWEAEGLYTAPGLFSILDPWGRQRSPVAE